MTYYSIKGKLCIRDLERISKLFHTMSEKMPEVNRVFIRKSVDYLDEHARNHLANSIGHSWYIPSGALMSSFQKVYDTEFGRLFNDYFTAQWVEYGTGIVGQGTHPESNGYQYDVNNHGDDGWVYRDKNGQYHFTRGMEAHRYMYNALIDYITTGYKECFSKAFDEVLGGVFKK